MSGPEHPQTPAPAGAPDDPAAPADPAVVAAWLTLAAAPDARAAWWRADGDTAHDPLALVARLRRTGVTLREPSADRLRRCLDWLGRSGTTLIGWGHPHYPETLAALEDPPAVLFAEGDTSLLAALQVAVVGSRKPTPAGAEHAFRMARELASTGIAITSGLATGIDAAAHRGALAGEPAGRTLGVPGSGPDVPYPREHAGLYRELATRGLLVSEFPPGMYARPHHFPRRNRIISGLSRAVVVVEAGLPSGTLITARLALAQGREVLAVPGSVANPQVRGCHALIRDGARLVEDAEQVLEELQALQLSLPGLARAPARTRPHAHAEASTLAAKHCENSFLPTRTASLPKATAGALKVLEALGPDATSIDAVVRRSGLTVSEVSSILASLELSGRVWAGPAGTFQRKPD